jgi:predicted 3-demethylubiquinone-9 3-methyltransferase (glyoxalase superfamily)
MAESIRPFLMFQGDGPAAIDFYLSTFPDAIVDVVDRHEATETAPAGAPRRGSITIAGQTILFFDSPPVHDFTFTPAFSLFVTCETEEEVRHLATVLVEGGTALMPLGNYGFSTLFAWVNDRFGLSWQLSYG